MTRKELTKLFITLAQISSPSGKEKLTAEFLRNYFNKKQDWKVKMDNAGKKNSSNTGNVYAYLEVNKNFDTLAFAAHMDTVIKDGEKTKVVFDGKVFKSDGTTILGADNRAGIVSLLAAVNNLNKVDLRYNILLFFPTREEAGKWGSSLFDKKYSSKIKYFFNIDGGAKPGTFVYKSLGFKNFTAKIVGVSAHAAKDYDSGIDAIKAASLFISLLPIGKDIKKETTFNIGKIKGGNATNVVCDLVEIEGEFRAFSISKMANLQKLIVTTGKKIERMIGVKIKIEFDESGSIPPFIGSPKSQISKLVKTISKKIGLKSTLEEAYYSADANSFSAKGFETITVSRGGEKAHTNKENLKLKDLESTIFLIKALIKFS